MSLWLFQPAECMEKILALKRNDDELELKRKQLVHLKMDASSVEAIKQLKGSSQLLVTICNTRNIGNLC